MASPPLCIAILVVKETSASVTVPLTRQGHILAVRGLRRREKLSPPGFDRRVYPKNRPMEGLGQRRPRSPSATAERTKCRGFQHFRLGCGIDEGRPGVAIRPRCRELLRERQRVPNQSIVFLSTCVDPWRGGCPPGDLCPTLCLEDWPQPNLSFQCSKGDLSWLGFA